MNRHEALTLTTVCLLAIVVAVAIMPSRSGLPISTVSRYLTMTSLGTTTVTVTETRTSTTESMITVGYTAAYALIGPAVGPLSGVLPPNQTGCMYLYGTDHNTYSLYNLPPNYSPGDVSVYGQYLTWEPFPQDSCSGIRIYVTSISQ
jgi:hypothetical protein